MKQRINLTLDTQVLAMLTRLSKDSHKYIGRKASRSEIIEVLVRKQFTGRRELLKTQISEMKQKLHEAEAEFYALGVRQQQEEAQRIEG